MDSLEVKDQAPIIVNEEPLTEAQVEEAPVVEKNEESAEVIAAEEEKTEFDVILKDAGAEKIKVIKVVREIVSGLGLKEAKDIVEAAPKTIKEGVSKEEAEKIAEQFKAVGATIEIK